MPQRRGHDLPGRLRLAAVLTTLAVAVAVAFASWTDSGLFVLVLIGVPLGAVAPVLVQTVRHRPAALATRFAAVVVLAWALVTGLGTGAYFLAPGVLLLLAAALTTSSRPLRRPRHAVSHAH